MCYRILVVCLLATSHFFATAHGNYALAQTEASITLRAAVEATMAANPLLTSYPHRKEALLGQRDNADLKPALNLGFELENIAGSGALNGLDMAEATLVLSSVIEMGDKRSAKVSVVNRRIDLLDAEQEIAELDLIAATAFRFIDVLAAQERLKLQQQARELAQQTITLLAPLVRAGKTPQLEISRANAALFRAEIAEQFAQSSLASARLKLSTLWKSQTPEFESAIADFFTLDEAGSLNTLLQSLDNNPNIALYANEQRLLDAQLREAQTQSQANIQWSAGIRHLREINDTGLVFSVSTPLFNGKRTTGAIRSNRAQLAEVETRRESSLNAIRGQLFSLHEQLVQAISETSILQQDVLPLLTEVLQQTRIAYEGGRYSYLDLISAQQEYLDAELALINSAANAHTLRTEIERLSGLPLSR